MTTLAQRNIDWGSAEIKGATLTINLTGANTKAWRQRFESVLALLENAHSRWDEVHLKKGDIQVTELQQGSEIELRHFLESIVLQVNSELPPPEDKEQDAEKAPTDEQDHADRQMTATFRAFADD